MEDYRHAAVALTGDFNPAIFHPEWFRQHEILPDIEVKSAEATTDLLISHQVTVIKFLSLRIEVLGERWTIASERADWFKDLGPITASIFRNLPHTPVKALSINFSEHRLAPIAPTEVMKAWISGSTFGTMIGDNSKIGLIGRATWEGYDATVVLEHSLHLKNGLFSLQSYEKKLKTAKDIDTIKWADVLARSNKISSELLGLSKS